MTEGKAFHRIGVNEAHALLARDDVLVLDVRDAQAYRRGHIKEAHNVSIANLWNVLETAPKDMPILIYCYHGYASQEFAQIFADFHFQEIYSLDGGFEGWNCHTPASDTMVSNAVLRDWLADNGFPAHGLEAVIDNEMTPLMKACHNGETGIVRGFLAAGAQLGARNGDGNNALWLACVGNHLDIIEILVDAGIDFNNRNDNAATPLMYAASAGKADVVEKLIAAGADLAPETLDGFTALDMAATAECLALLRRAARS